MSRLQLALNVDDLEQAVDFYSRLFAAEPAKRRPGYANFAIAEPPLKLVLFENAGQGGSINHLGVEVDDVDAVTAWSSRVGSDLATTDQAESTCCYATQEKFWIDDAPDGLGWEVYAVLADSATFAGEPEKSVQDAVCCAD
jgi:catechol 2,3-dioxygenase-like lactoylglutathione lyase family enzyme